MHGWTQRLATWRQARQRWRDALGRLGAHLYSLRWMHECGDGGDIGDGGNSGDIGDCGDGGDGGDIGGDGSEMETVPWSVVSPVVEDLIDAINL